MATATDSVLETLDKIADVLKADSGITSAFKTVGKIISPRLIPPLAATEMPAVFMAPVNSPETWVSSHHREVNHIIEVYVVNEFFVQGDDVRKIIQKIQLVADVLRGERLASHYLSKPIQIEGIDYDTLAYGDENRSFQFVGVVTLDCRRLFIGT